MNYQEVKRDGMILCLAGPSAGGKTSLANTLVNNFTESLTVSISATTRQPRAGEQDGVDYYFMDHDTFERKVGEGAFFEWAKVHGNLYGTLKSTIDSVIKNGRDLLLDIDIQGVRSIKSAYPKSTVTVFIVPPGVEELTRRIKMRSKTTPEEIEKRLQTAKIECSGLTDLIHENMIDYFLINDERATSEDLICSIYKAEKNKVARLSKADIHKVCFIDL